MFISHHFPSVPTGLLVDRGVALAEAPVGTWWYLACQTGPSTYRPQKIQNSIVEWYWVVVSPNNCNCTTQIGDCNSVAAMVVTGNAASSERSYFTQPLHVCSYSIWISGRLGIQLNLYDDICIFMIYILIYTYYYVEKSIQHICLFASHRLPRPGVFPATSSAGSREKYRPGGGEPLGWSLLPG